MGSPVQPSVLNPAGSGLTTMYGNQPNSLTMKPDSPTMMDQTPEDVSLCLCVCSLITATYC